MNYFFCDIRGTIDGCEENRYEQLSSFVELLENIILQNKEDKVIFEFVTSEDIPHLQKFLCELKPFIKDSNIVLGTHFANEAMIKDNVIIKNNCNAKVDKITQELKGKMINHIYIADDIHLNHIITQACLPNTRVTHFLPGKKVTSENYFSCVKYGISGLNECLENYYNSVKKITK